MNLIKLFICLIIIFLSTTVSAEFYKYVDENGNTCFTDDFNQVPKDQRGGLKVYEEAESDSNTDTVGNKVLKEKKVQSDSKNQEYFEKFHDRLSNIRLQLIEEHKEIKKEREQIKEERKNAETPEDVLKANEKIKGLNKKQEELKNKYEKFEAERKEYQKELEEAEANQNKEK
jgi:chromosome segregation ATPase